MAEIDLTVVGERLDMPVVLPPTLDFVDIRGMRVLIAEYVWSNTDRWINFPWSCQDPVVSVDNRDA